MKVKFNETCIDKYTGAIYNAGDVLEIEDKRAEEMLLNTKCVEKIKTAKKGKNKA